MSNPIELVTVLYKEAMEQKFTTFLVEGEIRSDLLFEGEITETRVHEGARPSDPKELERHIGAMRASVNSTQLLSFNDRKPGKIRTHARGGAGVAVLLPDALYSLQWTSDRFMDKLMTANMYGPFGPNGLLVVRKDTGAGWPHNCGDVCAGIVEQKDIELAAYNEAVEIAPYHAEGWAKIRLPKSPQHEEAVNAEQAKWWDKLVPGLDPTFEFELKPTPLIAADTVKIEGSNPTSYLLSGEPTSLELIKVMTGRMSKSQCQLMDLEHRDDKGNWIPLLRGFGVICPRLGRSPVMFPFAVPEKNEKSVIASGFDIKSVPIILEGENLATAVNAKVRSVLQALGWIPNEITT